MLTLFETDCKLFLRLYQNYHIQKKKKKAVFVVFVPPLKPPLGANFTTEQISCKSMVHHEPWGTSRFICSLPAVYRSCGFHICPRYQAHKCLMPMTSLLILLSSNVSHCVPLCRVLAATIGLLPTRWKWNQIWRLCARHPALNSTDSKYGFHCPITWWTMGSKMVQVKGAGSLSAPPQFTSARNAGWKSVNIGVGFTTMELQEGSHFAKHPIYQWLNRG